MGKSLSQMTLAELWALFPICLTPHCQEWAEWYAQEAETLRQNLPPASILRVAHIGSTAVPDIWAKPIIDILVETTQDCDWGPIQAALQTAGYGCMSKSARRMSFNKGYTESGFAERVFHLHLRRAGDHDELYFRDYLQEFPEVAKTYEALKLSLWKPYEHDRDGYTQRKGDLVGQVTQWVRARYSGRY